MGKFFYTNNWGIGWIYCKLLLIIDSLIPMLATMLTMVELLPLLDLKLVVILLMKCFSMTMGMEI